MRPSVDLDCTRVLQTLMQRAAVRSYRALSEQAQVSRWQVRQLQQGKVTAMRLGVLQSLATALKVSLSELLSAFGLLADGLADDVDPVAIRQEYARLQSQLDEQAGQLRSQFQADSLQVLESWLVQWPTAAHAALQQHEIPAKTLLPLVKPVERLVTGWGVVAIATVGDEIPYDPQRHDLMGGTAAPGDLVRVRYTGYLQGEKLLLRAKVQGS